MQRGTPLSDQALITSAHNAVVAVTTFYSDAIMQLASELAQVRKELQTSEARRVIAESQLQAARDFTVPRFEPTVKSG